MADPQKQLESTVLGTGLERAYEGLRQGPSKSTVIYLAVLGGVVVLFLLGRWLWTSSEQTNSQRWMQIDGMVFPEQASQVAKEPGLAGTAPGRTARYFDARVTLREGLRALASSTSRDIAAKQLEEAAAFYEELLKDEKTPLLRQEALRGAGEAYESLNKRDQAIEKYRQIAREFPDTGLARSAERQAKRLEDQAHKAELDELGKLLAPKGS